MKYFPVISTIKYLEKSWTGPDIFNEAPVPVQCTYGTEFSLGACYLLHHLIISGSSIQYGSRVTRIFL